MSEILKSSITEASLREAHKMSLENRELIKKAKICGCFCCMEIYKPEEINYWANDKTAIRPYCCLETVLSDNCGFPITIEFIKQMNQYYFC